MRPSYTLEAIVSDVPLVNTSLSFPHSRLITWFVTRWTRRVPLVEQELPTLPEHLSLPPDCLTSSVCESQFCGIIDQFLFYIDLTVHFIHFLKIWHRPAWFYIDIVYKSTECFCVILWPFNLSEQCNRDTKCTYMYIVYDEQTGKKLLKKSIF
jgi:hypothetical protein